MKMKSLKKLGKLTK